MRSSSEDEGLSKEILIHLSIMKPDLINSSINIPYSNYQKSHRSIFLASLKDTNFDVVCRMLTTMANKPLQQVGAGDLASFLHSWRDQEFAST